jgi:DNA-binding NarL/FixJ family response regulator
MPSNSNPPARQIRIAAIDDHSIIRAIIRTIAEDAPDMELAWSAPSIADARQKLATDTPDLILVDVTLPDGEGYEFIEEALRQHPNLPTLVISMHHEERYARRAHLAGARGYVMKNISPHDLVHIIQRVLQGETVFDPALSLG